MQERKEAEFLKQSTGGGFSRNVVAALLIFILLAALYSVVAGQLKSTSELSLSELALKVKIGEVQTIEVSDSRLKITLKNGEEATVQKEPEAGISETLKNFGANPESVDIIVKSRTGFNVFFGIILPFLAPVLLLTFFIWFMARRLQQGSMQAFTFGQSRARLITPDNTKNRVTFKDVAGVEEAKHELEEVVDFLKHPKKYLEIGAKIPKGVLLMGPPGSGKTMLARAVSGEAGVPFFHISGSEFIEMFVGVGASVTGDTPVLVRERGVTRLVPIQDVVDAYYGDTTSERLIPVSGLETLGVRRSTHNFRGFKQNKEKFNIDGSEFVSVRGVYRHRISEIYEIRYRGGTVRATGDHSVFVREKNYVRAKRVDELTEGDILVNLPYKVRSVFIPRIGTTHKVKQHQFDTVLIPELQIWDAEYRDVAEKYEYALAHAGAMRQEDIGRAIGMSQSVVGRWIDGTHRPRFFVSPSIQNGLPSRVLVTTELMRLFGYYVAEGRVTPYYVQFIFGTHERDLHQDSLALLERHFSVKPRIEHIVETNSTRITVSSRVLAEFFKRQFGTGSHNKQLPEWMWSLPKEYVFSFVDGYAKGDGYVTKDQKLSMSSVSRHLIRQLAWLLSMHGVQAGIRKMVTPAGRVIRPGGKPLPETVSWNLIIGKTSNVWTDTAPAKSPSQFKRPKVLSVSKHPYKGYVYDFVGCDNEAFFGGEKPILLHNSRVKDTFRLAKRSAPAIVFIDEIDAVGRMRGAGLGGGHDEREQTLNQLLVEMDGMETDDKTIVIAATNRPDVLDPALLRPGRFDRRVILDLPDINDRVKIIEVHARNKPLAETVQLRQVAERTPGFSGADLENLMNEAAILTARENRKQITQQDIVSSIEKVMLGPERKSHILSQEEKRIAAYHEIGHALVSASMPGSDPVHKVSIVSRGRAAGFTLKLPTEDRHLHKRSYFVGELAVAIGGYAAEELVFGDLTTGPCNDLEKATAIARSLVTRYGMSEKVGPMVLGDKEELIFLGREFGHERNYSEATAELIDKEVKRLIDDAHTSARGILTRRREKLEEITNILIEKETIEREEFEALVKGE